MDETPPRVAVVVGGGSGLGRAIAYGLAEDGCLVVVADADQDKAGQVAAELGEPHTGARVDVRDEDSVAELFTGVVTDHGRLDVVVNSAGISTVGLIVEHDAADFRSVVDVCLTGAFLVIKHAGRQLGEGGALLSLSSLNARQPGAGLAAYCSAKAGLSMLTQVAALELGPRGIRVNAIAPGLVRTPLTEPLHDIPGIAEDFLENMPLGRAGAPEEVAAAAVYLCSKSAGWITGEVLDINGGAHLGRYPDVLQHVRRAFG